VSNGGRLDVHGMVALILAVGATISVSALAIGAVLTDAPLAEHTAALLTTALGALVGAVSVYLGGTLARGRRAADRAADRRAADDTPRVPHPREDPDRPPYPDP
jgi:membrane protein DedA with SNARE-associated domain